MEHGHGIGEDLPLLNRLATRRHAMRALACVAAGGAAIGAAGRMLGPPPPPRRTSVPHQAGGIYANPKETGGPYPADGSNASDGPTSDVLRKGGIVRRDMTRSFLGSTATASGVPMVLDLQVLDVDRSGAPAAGRAVYAWHCNANGEYSLYGRTRDESWLRGVQVADGEGRVRFLTVFPGAYDGRWPHVHLEVHRSLDSIRRGERQILTTQLAVPGEMATRVYSGPGYDDSMSHLSRSRLSRDMVFGESSPGELLQQTLDMRVRDVQLVASARVGLIGASQRKA